MSEQQYDQQALTKKVKRICGKFWTTFNIDSFQLSEDVRGEATSISCILSLSHRSKDKIKIEGTGKGMVDVLYSTMVRELAKEYISLGEYSFVSFEVAALIDANNKTTPPTESKCKVYLKIANSRGKIFLFEQEAFSMTAAALRVVQRALELFVNSEIATIKTYQALKDAQKRNRTDLIIEWTDNLADLVAVTCYADIIEREKKNT